MPVTFGAPVTIHEFSRLMGGSSGIPHNGSFPLGMGGYIGQEVVEFEVFEQRGKRRRRTPSRDVTQRLPLISERQRKDLLGLKPGDEASRNIGKEFSAIRASRRKNCCKKGCECGTESCPCVQMGINCHKEGDESEQGCLCSLEVCHNPYGRYYFDPEEVARIRALKILSLGKRGLVFEDDLDRLTLDVETLVDVIQEDVARSPDPTAQDAIAEILSPRRKGLGIGLTDGDSPIQNQTEAEALAQVLEAVASESLELPGSLGEAPEEMSATEAYKQARASKQAGASGRLKNKPGTAKTKSGEKTGIDDWLSPPPSWMGKKATKPEADAQDCDTEGKPFQKSGTKHEQRLSEKSAAAEEEVLREDMQKALVQEDPLTPEEKERKDRKAADRKKRQDQEWEAMARMARNENLAKKRLEKEAAMESAEKARREAEEAAQAEAKTAEQARKLAADKKALDQEKWHQEMMATRKANMELTRSRSPQSSGSGSSSPQSSRPPSSSLKVECVQHPLVKDLEKLSVKQLRDYAHEQDLPRREVMLCATKKELVEYIVSLIDPQERSTSLQGLVGSVGNSRSRQASQLATPVNLEASLVADLERVAKTPTSTSVSQDRDGSDLSPKAKQERKRVDSMTDAQLLAEAIAEASTSDVGTFFEPEEEKPFRERLLDFYAEKGQPQMLSQVDRLLEKYQGREEELMNRMVKKYGVSEE